MNNQYFGDKRILQLTAWIVILAVSDLPDIIFVRLGDAIPVWIAWAKISFLIAFLISTIASFRLRPLRHYALVLLTLFTALELTSFVRNSEWFQSNYNYSGVSFFTGYAAVMTLDIFVALAVIAVLLVIKRDRKSFFLVKGKTDAPIGPVRWLGIKEGESWKTFGWIFTIIAALAVFIPTVLSSLPSNEAILRALPLLPAAVLFAAVNAFTEEVYFRAGILSTLLDAIGKTQTLLITIAFFGLSHWLYGSPSGIIGFLMTGFLAYLLGKSMLETKGLLWPWTIHFVPDVVVFISYALNFVQS